MTHRDTHRQRGPVMLRTEAVPARCDSPRCRRVTFRIVACLCAALQLAIAPASGAPRVPAGDPTTTFESRPTGDDGVTARDRYSLCLKYFKRANYTKALETCNRVRNFHRDDPVSVLAELAVADIYEKRGDNEQAEQCCA